MLRIQMRITFLFEISEEVLYANGARFRRLYTLWDVDLRSSESLIEMMRRWSAQSRLYWTECTRDGNQSFFSLHECFINRLIISAKWKWLTVRAFPFDAVPWSMRFRVIEYNCFKFCLWFETEYLEYKMLSAAERCLNFGLQILDWRITLLIAPTKHCLIGGLSWFYMVILIVIHFMFEIQLLGGLKMILFLEALISPQF